MDGVFLSHAHCQFAVQSASRIATVPCIGILARGCQWVGIVSVISGIGVRHSLSVILEESIYLIADPLEID
jgi:hypothetical protein